MPLQLSLPSLERLATGSTSHLHPSGRDSGRSVSVGVGDDVEDFEIVRVVIVLSAVSMMDVLSDAQRSAKYSLHNNPVLEVIASIG